VHTVVLVPGFFGFGKFGELNYFNGVADALARAFERLGQRVRVVEVATLPTASIRQRAARVLETLVEVATHEAGPIHIVGHSTGGLDARLAIAPTAALPTNARLADYRRISSLVSVCCPHFGTPLAAYFSGVWGRFWLGVFTSTLLFWLERPAALKVLLRLFHWVVRMRDPFRKRPGTFDEVYAKLLDDFSDERRLELVRFLKAVAADQALLFQLTPASCDLLNACTAEPELRHGSVIARAEPPRFRWFVRSNFDFYNQIVYPFYSLLHRIAARGARFAIPEPVPEQREKLLALSASLPSATDSDGIVPTHSQIWGALVHYATADHLDVVGQYGIRDVEAQSGDWLPSYSGFDTAQFNALWLDVARFLLQTDEPKLGEQRADVARTATDHVAVIGSSAPVPRFRSPSPKTIITSELRH